MVEPGSFIGDAKGIGGCVFLMLGGVLLLGGCTYVTLVGLQKGGVPALNPTSTPIPTATRLPTATSIPKMICQEIRPGSGAQSLAMLKQQGYDSGLIYFTTDQDDGSSKGFDVNPVQAQDLPKGRLCGKKKQ